MFAGSVIFCKSLAVQLLNDTDRFNYNKFLRTPENKEWLRQHLGKDAPKDERVDHFPAIEKKIRSNPCDVNTLLFCDFLERKIQEELAEDGVVNDSSIASKMLASMGIKTQEG